MEEEKKQAKDLVNKFYQPLGMLSCGVSSNKMWEYSKERAREMVASNMAAIESVSNGMHENLTQYQHQKKILEEINLL